MIGLRDLGQWASEAKEDSNPYLAEWFRAALRSEGVSELFFRGDELVWQQELTKLIENGTSELVLRKSLVAKYAWAVPCRAALEALVEMSPLVEMGAGTGYWMKLLQDRGADVVGFDNQVPGQGSPNQWHGANVCWTEVLAGDPHVLRHHRERSLLLCWPPFDDRMASDCLKNYRGSRLAFIGEHSGGCCATDEFFEELEKKWQQAREIEIPQFDCLHDYMTVWAR